MQNQSYIDSEVETKHAISNGIPNEKLHMHAIHANRYVYREQQEKIIASTHKICYSYLLLIRSFTRPPRETTQSKTYLA